MGKEGRRIEDYFLRPVGLRKVSSSPDFCGEMGGGRPINVYKGLLR